MGLIQEIVFLFTQDLVVDKESGILLELSNRIGRESERVVSNWTII